MFYLVISQGFATLKELQEYYSFGDVMNMMEVLLCKNYNENLAIKQSREK